MRKSMELLISKYTQLVERKNAEATKRTLLSTQGINLWLQLRDSIKQIARDFNDAVKSEAVTWDESNPISLSITRSIDKATLTGTYEGSQNSATFRCTQPEIDEAFIQGVQSEELCFFHVDPVNGRNLMNKTDDIAYGLFDKFVSK